MNADERGFRTAILQVFNPLDRKAKWKKIHKAMRNVKLPKKTYWPQMNADFERQFFRFLICVHLRSSAANIVFALFSMRVDSLATTLRIAALHAKL
jgi:hypothetical protein